MRSLSKNIHQQLAHPIANQSMDTLSAAPISNFKIPTSLYPKSHELNIFKNHLISQQFTTQINSNNKVSKTFNNPPLLNSSSSQPTTTAIKTTQKSLKLQLESHQNPSTGYAVALLDAARCHHALESVSRDVNRLSRWLRNEEINNIISDPLVGKKEKGDILREIVKRGKFNKYLSRLVNLLVEKINGNKVEILVREVLVEFGRIYDELAAMSGGSDCTETTDDQVVVLVSSGVKLGINQVLGVAKTIQKISGAVKVTVRATCYS